jgi:hypothetical protein
MTNKARTQTTLHSPAQASSAGTPARAGKRVKKGLRKAADHVSTLSRNHADQPALRCAHPPKHIDGTEMASVSRGWLRVR